MKNERLAVLQAELRACRRCAEAGFEITGPPIFSGNATAQVMIIGQAPGLTEVENQRPFNYTSGTRLFKWLGQAGWEEADFRARHYLASVTRCFPGRDKNGRGDRVPTPQEQELCAAWRVREFELLDLKLIIPVGKLAIGLFCDASQPLRALIGQKFEYKGSAVVPLPHPSGASSWHMQEENKLYLAAAIDHLKELREQHGL